ncbi:MAG TPA: hypothetical protein VGL99_12040 [Chloroflexota bacterium]|jgi:hypothetical protein
MSTSTVIHDPITAEHLQSQRLWRFALVGLGPLMTLGVIAFWMGLIQRLA